MKISRQHQAIYVYKANGVKTRRFEPRLVRREDVEDLLTTLTIMKEQVEAQLNTVQDETWLVTHAQNIMTAGTDMHKDLIRDRNTEKNNRC